MGQSGCGLGGKESKFDLPTFAVTENLTLREQSHIPPLEKENHLQNLLFQGIC